MFKDKDLLSRGVKTGVFLLLFGIVGTLLSGCSTISGVFTSNPVVTIEDVVGAQPPTASKMAPYCTDTPVTVPDQVLCKEYQALVVGCQINLMAAGGIFEGVVGIVPGYGTAIATAVGVITPIVSADQLWWCSDLGYITKTTTVASSRMMAKPRVVYPPSTTFTYDGQSNTWVPSNLPISGGK